MEEGKSSGIAQSTEESVVKASSQGGCGGKSCQSSPSSGVKGNGRCSAGQQQLPVGHRRHTAMAQQHAALGGQSQSSHGGGWGATPVWEHARNIAESMEGGGGGPPDYNGGRSVDWDVKGSSWGDWEHVGVGSVFPPGRRGEVHTSSASFASGGGQSAESVSVASPGHRGSLITKNEGDLHDNPPPDSSRVGNLGGVEHRPSSQGSALNTDQQRRLALGLGETGGFGERRKSNVQEYSNGTRVNVGGGGGGDSMIGLKLGRRTYFEDSGGGRGAVPAVFTVCPPGKKQRVQSPGVQVPRCQVEGCKQDLSSSKDYHRRHKVCELHSKATKVIAAGFEQRFCQQCSRFHVLTEFDEGKRSCRRRLAGHNERRRKPPPESAAIVSTGSSAVFQNENGSHANNVNAEEGKRGTNGLTEQACFIPMQRTPGSSSTSVESDDQSGSLGTNFKLNQGKGPWPVLGRADDSTGLTCQSQVACGERQPFLSSTTDRVLMFLQSPKGQIAGAGVHQFSVEGSGSMGPGLTLASSSGPASVLAGLDAPTSPSVSGISDSGRALSLLSSQAWGSRGGASGSVSLAVSTQSDVTLEQLISENSRTFSPRGPQSHFHGSGPGTAEKYRLRPHSPRELGVSSVSRGEGREQHRGMLSGLGMVGNYESHTMLAVMQGQSEYRGIQGSANSTQRPTIDLMQLPSPPSHGFGEFSALRPFESSLFDSQQML